MWCFSSIVVFFFNSSFFVEADFRVVPRISLELEAICIWAGRKWSAADLGRRLSTSSWDSAGGAFSVILLHSPFWLVEPPGRSFLVPTPHLEEHHWILLGWTLPLLSLEALERYFRHKDIRLNYRFHVYRDSGHLGTVSPSVKWPHILKDGAPWLWLWNFWSPEYQITWDPWWGYVC